MGDNAESPFTVGEWEEIDTRTGETTRQVSNEIKNTVTVKRCASKYMDAANSAYLAAIAEEPKLQNELIDWWKKASGVLHGGYDPISWFHRDMRGGANPVAGLEQWEDATQDAHLSDRELRELSR